MIDVVTEQFIHTNILAQQRITRKMSREQSFPLLSISLGMVILVCFFFLWVRICIIQTGYQISRAHEHQGQLIQQNNALRVERAALMATSRIETIARNELGMINPKSKQIIVLEW
jgi:cell division protein FtsL